MHGSHEPGMPDFNHINPNLLNKTKTNYLF